MKRQTLLLLIVLGIFAVTMSGCGPTARTAYDAGKAYQDNGGFADAIRMYQQFADNYQHDFLAPNALYNIGLCYEKMGQIPEAVKAFNKVKARYPASDSALWAQRAINRIGKAQTER